MHPEDNYEATEPCPLYLPYKPIDLRDYGGYFEVMIPFDSPEDMYCNFYFATDPEKHIRVDTLMPRARTHVSMVLRRRPNI